MVTAATLLNTSLGKVIGIFNEYAYLGKGSSIHSSDQLEWFKTLVDEKSIKVGGTQLITTLDGYSIPLLIRDGLAYATSLGRPTDQDMDTYPHVFFTSPDEWDPSVLDHDPPHLDGLNPSQVSNQHFGDPMFDAYGDFNERKAHDPPHLDGLNPSQVSDQHFGDPMFDAYGDFNERIIANLNILLHLQEIVGHTQQSPLFPQSISIRVHPKSLIGMPYAHSLHGHPHPASRTLSMSPPGMELLHIPRITSRNTLSLEILSSTSPDAVKLLQQTPSSLTPLLLMMVQPWPNFSVAVIPLSVMHMA